MNNKRHDCIRSTLFVLGCLWKIAIPLLSSLISLKLLSMYNVFEYIGPLKATDKAFDIGITTYFSMLDILLTVLTNKLKELLPRQSLEIIFSTQGMCGTANTVSYLVLNKEQPSEAKINISIHANRKTVEKMKITLNAINFATMQPPEANAATFVGEDGNFYIDIGKMIGNSSYVDISQTFKILFVEEPIDCEGNAQIQPELNKCPLFLDITQNKLEIRKEV